MKALLLLLLPFFFNTSPVQKNRLLGAWVHEKDPKSIVKFDKEKVFYLYDKDTTLAAKYTRSKKSCDQDYYTSEPNKFDFIKIKDGECYEITGLSDSVLAYRHTATGKLHVFFRLKEK